MTLQDLIDELTALPLSARTAAVYCQPAYEEDEYLLPLAVCYEHGDVTIKTSPEGK